MKVQNALGSVHSYDVWLGLLQILKDSSGRDAGFRKAVKFLDEECVARRAESYRAFLKLWGRLKKRKTWARLSFFTLDRK